MSSGKFITFEGIDGCGKSTQAVFLSDYLRERNHAVYTTAEPSPGPVGVMIRQVLSGRLKINPDAVAALFAADRLDHISNPVNGLRQMLDKGTTVICDRYYFSSYAYHSLDLPMEWVMELNKRAALSLKPDMTIFIDVDPDTAMERISKNRASKELFEKKEVLERVRKLYFEAFDRLSGVERVEIVDGGGSPEDIALRVRSLCMEAGIFE